MRSSRPAASHPPPPPTPAHFWPLRPDCGPSFSRVPQGPAAAACASVPSGHSAVPQDPCFRLLFSCVLRPLHSSLGWPPLPLMGQRRLLPGPAPGRFLFWGSCSFNRSFLSLGPYHCWFQFSGHPLASSSFLLKCLEPCGRGSLLSSPSAVVRSRELVCGDCHPHPDPGSAGVSVCHRLPGFGPPLASLTVVLLGLLSGKDRVSEISRVNMGL